MDSSSPSSPIRSDARPFSSDWIESTLGLASGPALTRFSSFTTDSRSVPAGAVFVAIRGEKKDGHDFIPTAIAGGATAVLAENSVLTARSLPAQFPQVRFFGVEDVLEAFRTLASAWRSKFSIPVVLVAGSNGKTTTKELLAALLRGRHASVLKTAGSQNGYLGIPMTLIELREHHGAAVIEVGIDEVGAMERHVPLVRPTHALLTVIGPEHLEKLIDVATVAREECVALHETQKRGGRCLVNLDDPWVAPTLAKLPGAWSFSLDPKGPAATNRIDGRYAASEGSGTLDVVIPGGSVRLDLPLPGRHNAQNLLAAVAAAACIGLDAGEIRKGLATFEGADGRSQLRALPNPPGALAICDYYNASPVSMAAAFELLAQTGAPDSPRLACLADMKELGTDELRFHAELAGPLLKSGVSAVLLHGPRMRSLEESLRKSGFSGTLRHFDDLAALATEARRLLQPGSVVLIKGSRSMKMETVWQELQKP